MDEKVLKNKVIHYWIRGVENEKAILFLHPAFGDHTCFDSQLEYFKTFKVITLDLIGHGKSIGKGRIEDTAEDMIQILDSEGIDKVNLVGVSIGAVFAQDFANKYPNRVASLCCIGGYDINNFTKELQSDNDNQHLKMMFKAMFSIRSFAEDNKKMSAYTKDAQKRFYEMNLRFKKSSFRYLASLGKLINRYQTSRREYPLLIGVGEHDHEMAKKASLIWHHSEPESVYVEFSGAGHLVNMDTPDQFNEALMNMIR